MIRPDRRALILGAGALLAGCALPRDEADGLAEDTRPPAEGGIGGTGIVGTVTALGSIRVNGLRVALPPEAEIADAFGPVSAEALRPGASVTVEARGTGAALEAVRVRLDHPLVGAVERVSADGRGLRVLGTEVALEPGVAAAVRPGERVAVFGLWDGARVVASRVDPQPPGPAVMAGALRREPAGLALGGLRLILLPRIAPPPAGSFVTLAGTAEDGAFVARSLSEGRFTGAAGPLERLSVEGYLEPVAEAPGHTVSGLGHSFDPAARPGPVAGRRAIFVGPYTGAFAVAAALPLPEGPEARARLLARPGPIAERAEALPTR